MSHSHYIYSYSSPSSGHPVDFLWALLSSPPQVWAAGEERKTLCTHLPPERNYPEGSSHCILAQRHWPENSNILFNILPNHKASMNRHVIKAVFARFSRSRQIKSSSKGHYVCRAATRLIQRSFFITEFGYEKWQPFRSIFQTATENNRTTSNRVSLKQKSGTFLIQRETLKCIDIYVDKSLP